MASVTITTPTSGSTVARTFGASGGYDISSLEKTEGDNYVESVVTHRGSALDTQVYQIPGSSQSGTWSVTHTIPGTRTLTGCVVTASLYVDSVMQQSAFVDDITISG